MIKRTNKFMEMQVIFKMEEIFKNVTLGNWTCVEQSIKQTLHH